MLTLNEGMTIPTSVTVKEDKRIQRIKCQLFKFWPSKELKEAWITYSRNE
jgi:hypothetical protein